MTDAGDRGNGLLRRAREAGRAFGAVSRDRGRGIEETAR